MKRTVKPSTLVLSRTTLRGLSPRQLGSIAGGPDTTADCGQPYSGTSCGCISAGRTCKL